MKKTLVFSAFIAILGFLSGCYPEGAEYVDELDVTAGFHDKEYDFSVPKTFFLIDTVVHVVDGDVNEEPDHSKDELILNKIKSNLLAIGYTEGIEGDADLIVATTALQSNYSGYYWWNYWYYWWGWYPGWGGYYPGWGYPGYPGWGYPIYYSYSIGTVLIEMVDTDRMISNPIEPGEDLRPTVYAGVLNGLLQGSDSYIEARIDAGIDDLFKEMAPFKLIPTPN